MAQDDTRLFRPQDIAAGFALLTRLPVPVAEAAFARGAATAWSYPLVGAVLGGGAGGLGLALLALGLPAMLAAGLSLAALVVVTGAMHEDGLADSADGLWGGWERARRLEIMKDSHIGSYGVIALVLSLGLRWMALAWLFEAGLALPALIAAGALSRAALPVLMHAMPHARADGLSHSVGRAPFDTALLAVCLGGTLALLSLGLTALPLALVLALAIWAVAALARAKIGGQTGDILGAAQQVGEITVLLMLTAL